MFIGIATPSVSVFARISLARAVSIISTVSYEGQCPIRFKILISCFDPVRWRIAIDSAICFGVLTMNNILSNHENGPLIRWTLTLCGFKCIIAVFAWNNQPKKQVEAFWNWSFRSLNGKIGSLQRLNCNAGSFIYVRHFSKSLSRLFLLLSCSKGKASPSLSAMISNIQYFQTKQIWK